MSLTIKLPKFRLIGIKFALPEQTGRASAAHYQTLSGKLERLAHTAGTGSDAFRKRKEHIHHLLHTGKRVQEVVQTPKDIRPLVELWQACDECVDRNPIDRAILKHLTALRQRQSLLVLFASSQLFFDRFDLLGDTQSLAAFIRSQFRLNTGRKFSQTMARFAKYARILFALHGPAAVVEQARKDGLPLEKAAASLGIPLEREGRFFAQCKNIYYLDTLKGLRVGQDHEVLHELVRKDAYESAYESGWLLGHKVVQIMVDKATGHQEMPANWLRVILSIAGDPRVSTRSSNFVRWWARLGSEYVKQVRQWLSGLDIELFLEVLGDYMEHSYDLELQRMFPARKRFLKGLFEKRLVRDTRLFLSGQAARYVRRHYNENDIPAYSRVAGSISVIYLNIDGKHVVEGTHSFSLRIYQRLPRRNPVEDYDRNTFSSRDLGKGLWEDYVFEFGDVGVISITHYPDRWQREALAAFRSLGTHIDPSDVLSSEDYRRYRRRYGV